VSSISHLAFIGHSYGSPSAAIESTGISSFLCPCFYTAVPVVPTMFCPFPSNSSVSSAFQVSVALDGPHLFPLFF